MAFQMHENGHLLDKIHSHDTSHGAVGPSIRDIAGIIGQTSLDIMVHAPEETQGAQALPSCETLVAVYGFLGHIETTPMAAELRMGNGNCREKWRFLYAGLDLV